MSKGPPDLAEAKRLTAKEAIHEKARADAQASNSMKGLGIPAEFSTASVSLSARPEKGVPMLTDWVRAKAADAFKAGGGLSISTRGTPKWVNTVEELVFLTARALILSHQSVRVLRVVELVDQVVAQGMSRFDPQFIDQKGLVLLDFDAADLEGIFTAREIAQTEAWLRRWMHDARGLVAFSREGSSIKSPWTEGFLDFVSRRTRKCVISPSDIFIQ